VNVRLSDVPNCSGSDRDYGDSVEAANLVPDAHDKSKRHAPVMFTTTEGDDAGPLRPALRATDWH
jgi:hypothetical protein